MTLWERGKKQQAERAILIAARIISPSIAPSFSEGYAWCVEAIKSSVYASLANELEINKALELIRQGNIEQAIEDFLVFHNKENKVASAAANNLALISIMKDEGKISEGLQYCEQSLNHDRYNANALVNKGNAYFISGDFNLAATLYKEAMQIETSIQAIYNLGMVSKQLNDLEEAKRCFFKLNGMLANNVQILIQLAEIYELQGQKAQSMELYTQANNLSPTDPAILFKLAKLYDAEGDKTQAFQCHLDSYRYFPSNIEVIKWLGNYYLNGQLAEKAVNYFEKAALMEPNNIEWQLLDNEVAFLSG